MDKQVSATRTIAASPEKIFAVLADPAQHAAIDGSDTIVEPREEDPQRLELGAKFGMSMRYGIPYKISNEVVEFTENRRIAWRHMAHHVWRYELEPVDDPAGGTRVTETFDWSSARGGFAYPWVGIPKRNLASIEQTLAKLDAYVTDA